MDSALTSQLEEGCRILNVAQQPQDQPQLLAYLELLIKWNKAYNLTAVRDPAQMVTKHLLDSLAIAPHLRGQRLIDVGTGGGLPGVPMAILFPEREFHLLDSNGKKTRFLFQVKTALRLDNMTVHQARVESFAPEAPYDTVLSRAFATIGDMVGGCRHLLGPDGHFLAMKGVYPEEEIAVVAESCRLEAVHELHVPGLDEQRHLVDMTPR
ncbi:16S rRNA (guanine(527)-N(7))-methyltransferase RsmG [Halioglobus japonicus]|uniref:Ribosomal RNA small subunit methyltransferase G n=1 Tax=Halioglobus japonicus TaxID=930805 RepID=A0AAP8MD06_9GAMM|nr:16S rRNA (guanine(527)-N(7))-methyltransferase RsmG [Halioglobus japonicus]AQA17360.1 16S rRNA (guanine(527)-N(7))-methyltransferase RsmG [Halioglobus japonicus]PLW85282.1 16S rRNA (guanine(527)-N(7))-methyltransferase RsmG [Halioglobus japonicus]GHD22549.1 ribosomal RNA small subunit methyltransferase G [Halioglobus japonicus]